MPKETFYNLPKVKQEKIIQSAEEEFFEYGFDLASIQRIIKKAGIPRGSFYQYFEDKTDIYVVVLRKITEQKKEFLAPVFSMMKGLGFFDFLKLLYKQGFQFARKNPLAVQIAKDMIVSKTLEKEKLLETMKEEFYTQLHIDFHSIYLELIKNAIAQGEMTDACSPETVNFYIQTVFESIGKNLIAKNISDPFGEEGEKIISEFISIMKHGLCRQENLEQGGHKAND